MMKKIMIAGSTLLDLKGCPFTTYNKDGRNAGYIIEKAGGVARNVCEDLAHVGIHPIFLTVLDHSVASTDIATHLQQCGTDVSHITYTEDGLGKWLAVFDEHGDVVSSISQRPNLEPLRHVLKELGDVIASSCDGIVCALDIDRIVLEQLFYLAEKYDVPVYGLVSNMTIASQRKDLIQKTACFVCNKEEASILFQKDFMSMHGIELIDVLAQQRKEMHLQQLIITDGPYGAVYVSAKEAGHVPCADVEVVNTTGCGDAFFAGAAASLVQGSSLCEAALQGTKLAGAALATHDNVCPMMIGK